VTKLPALGNQFVASRYRSGPSRIPIASSRVGLFVDGGPVIIVLTVDDRSSDSVCTKRATVSLLGGKPGAKALGGHT
jgi:hypothetical protein